MSDVPSGVPSLLGMPLPFGREEYERRLNAARRQLQQQKLDAVLLFHQESMFYLFGYDQLGYWVYQTAVLTADGRDIIAVCRAADYNLIAGLPFVADARVWRDDSADDPAATTRAVLSELGVLRNAARIGIELHSHGLLPYYYGRLLSELDDHCEIVDASKLVTELRLHKSDAEVAYLREAAHIMDAGYDAAFAALRPGVSEIDVFVACTTAMYRAGGHVPAIQPPLGSGPRTMATTHGAPMHRRIGEGEPVTLEVGGCRHRYHAVGVQTKWLGCPPPKVKQSFDQLTEALAAAREAARPGTPTADVFRAVSRRLARHGIDLTGRHAGYGTGIGFPPSWLDNLRLKETDTHILEPNMVFFLYCHHQLQSPKGYPITMFVGEPILVTNSDCARLSSTPLTLEIPD